MNVATTSTSNAHKVLSLRAVIRLARLRETPRDKALAALTKTLAVAPNAEKVQALAALGAIPTIESFKVLVPYIDQKGLADAAGSAAIKIAPRIIGKNKALVRTTLEKVIANVRSARTKTEAQKLLGTGK